VLFTSTDLDNCCTVLRSPEVVALMSVRELSSSSRGLLVVLLEPDRNGLGRMESIILLLFVLCMFLKQHVFFLVLVNFKYSN
jgi:hypothetical protein